MTPAEAISKLVSTFSQAPKVQRIVLFGSRARGDNFPRSDIDLAKAYWIRDEETWLAMLDDRNRTSHTYKRELAEEIYAHIKSYLPELERVYRALLEGVTGHR
ncbi:MAG: HI0074 family nucleotidyltransferase substrate-binding subunit [Myxococcota bacterium]